MRRSCGQQPQGAGNAPQGSSTCRYLPAVLIRSAAKPTLLFVSILHLHSPLISMDVLNSLIKVVMAAGLHDSSSESTACGWAKRRGTRTRRVPGFGANTAQMGALPLREQPHTQAQELRTHSNHAHQCRVP